MDNYWDNYIQTKIIQPLEVALQGKDPGVGTDGYRLYLSGKVWNVSDKNGQGNLLRTYMRPYVEEYLFAPAKRMQGVYTLDETSHAYWQRMGTGFVSEYLREREQVSTLFVDKDLHSVVETWLDNQCGGYRLYENRSFLIIALREGYNTDWITLHSKVIPELKDCPSDYDKIRLEYYCFLDAIIKVALDDNSRVQKCEYWQQINQSWDILSAIYSVMTGKLINTGYNQFNPLISQFKSKNKEFATLMVAALRHHPEVLINNKAWQIKSEIEQSSKEIKQNTELNNLCRILFPTAQWSDYDLKTPRMTTAEMMQKVRESEELKRLLKQVEEYARTLQTELDDAIKMQSLREAFTHLDPATARAIFAQIDMVLEDNNEVWDRNRLELKREVNLRYENHQRMIEGTHEQAQLAADYSKQAATQTHLIQVEGGDVKCEFHAPVGNVIGNVENLTSNK